MKNASLLNEFRLIEDNNPGLGLPRSIRLLGTLWQGEAGDTWKARAQCRNPPSRLSEKVQDASGIGEVSGLDNRFSAPCSGRSGCFDGLATPIAISLGFPRFPATSL